MLMMTMTLTEMWPSHRPQTCVILISSFRFVRSKIIFVFFSFSPNRNEKILPIKSVFIYWDLIYDLIKCTNYPLSFRSKGIISECVYPPQCTGIYSSNLKIHKLRVYGSSFVACVVVFFSLLFRRLFFVPTFAVVWKSENI